MRIFNGSGTKAPASFIFFLFLVPLGALLNSCERREAFAGLPPEFAEMQSAYDEMGQFLAERDTDVIFDEFLDRILSAAEIPDDMALKVMDAALEGPSFILDILTCMSGDPFLYALVDKGHPLPPGYAPDDLVSLAGIEGGDSYRISRNGLLLRRPAADALEEMAAAAKAEGVILTVGSTYRSYDYQTGVYSRIVGELGQEAADRESARPGHSQHQTGLTLDFAPIDDSFAATMEGEWVLANAGRFGWSLSFPDGYEPVTGYRWESWHYRYTGKDIVSFIDAYFGGIQQYALRFLYEWQQAEQ
ncbi:MAG: M15 family metallopeptidase [Spirochaetaceae bacterium]|jgi:D-alanyl-D-alanine carboxypeptidase|nr:M15 family metallopeptidase [Spirochaetaceae bacterium]